MKTSVDERVGTADDLQRQARVWLRLLTSTDVKAYDTEGFQRWLRISPAHKAAFGEVKQRWDALEPASRAFLRTHPDAADAHRHALQAPRRGRRAFLGAAVSAAAVAGVAGMAVAYPPARLWPAPDEWGADERTATGEQRALALAADRVRVTLNTQTSIRHWPAGEDTPGIDLLAGEAAFELVPDSPPFAVMAGAGRTVARSGRFDVRYLDGKVCVTCMEGALQIEHPAGNRVLGSRQQTVYDAHAVGGVAGIEPAIVSAWQRGELVFNEGRLIDVIAEINRYRSGRVVLMKTSVQNRPVSGRFLVASLDSVIAQLQQMFDLHARWLPGGLVVLS
ncbi:FecR family protein [Variovorax sp.]|jgi:transmembrane sensor|uniref:FecR family protein n=1 Tax=Variovorax sp. TaxID=1871043 RepID=UPI0037D9BDDD